MKILILCHGFPPDVGGGYRYLGDLTRQLRSHGHQVDALVVSHDRNEHVEEDPGGTIFRVPRTVEWASARLSTRYPEAFRRMADSYDVLHFNFPSPVAEASYLLHAAAARATGRVATYHADVVPRKPLSRIYNRFVARPFLKGMNRVIASSPNFADSSPQLADIRQRVRVVPFGIDPASMQCDSLDQAEGGGQGQETRPLRLLFVGRLAPYKGLPYLIDAMRGCDRTHLRIVGTGELEAELRGRAATLGLQDRIQFTGFAPAEELLQQYARADVLVLPSIDPGETFGYVLIEAALNRTALISTELGTGTSFANKDGETGIVVPPRNSGALSAAIRRLEEDRTLVQRYAARARERVLSDFTVERMTQQTVSVYEEAITAPAG